jgi:histidinol-phosphate aminotransferase
MTDFVLPIRADLRGMSPYGAPQDIVKARLNVNENPFVPSEALRSALSAAVFEATGDLNRYPDRDAWQLREALASYIERESGFECDAQKIWPANGSNEVMAQVFSAFGGPDRCAITFPPTYSMYPEYARNAFTQLVAVGRNNDFTINVGEARAAIELHKPALVLIASPNNPTGTAISLMHLRDIIECARDNGALVVVDEAYAEFRHNKNETAVRLLDSYPNLIVTRTLSKAFGFAGARVGYCLCSNSAIVNALMLVRLPYHLSAITQAAAVAALENSSELMEQVELLRDQREVISSELLGLGLNVSPSDANFVFFGEFVDRHAIWQGLYERGVLIRETGPDRWLRVSVGTPEENELFLEAIAELLPSDR